MDATSRLFKAISKGDLSGAEAAIRDGADVNGVDFDHTLNYAIMYLRDGALEFVKFLHGKGASLDPRNIPGEHGNYVGTTPMHTAALYGANRVLEYIIGEKADVGMQDAIGRTALHLAAKGDNAEGIGILLDAGSDFHGADNFYCQSPMDIARQEGNENAITALDSWAKKKGIAQRGYDSKPDVGVNEIGVHGSVPPEMLAELGEKAREFGFRLKRIGEPGNPQAKERVRNSKN